MLQVTIVWDKDGLDKGTFNRFDVHAIPRVGDEIAIVHGEKETLVRVTQVRLRAYRCGIDTDPYYHESAAMVQVETIQDDDYIYIT